MARRPNRPSPPAVPSQEPESATNTRVVHARWKGPLPPPAQLEEFDRIVSGGAERIFKQFEDEAAHRRAMEAKNASFVIRDTHIGQGLAGLFALGMFSLTGYAISQGAYTLAV